MEGLLTSIGDSALVKLAELTVQISGIFVNVDATLVTVGCCCWVNFIEVRLLMSGKMPNEMLSELKPFAPRMPISRCDLWCFGVSSFRCTEVGKQKASELTATTSKCHGYPGIPTDISCDIQKLHEASTSGL